jgi:hypothetical protein
MLNVQTIVIVLWPKITLPEVLCGKVFCNVPNPLVQSKIWLFLTML